MFCDSPVFRKLPLKRRLRNRIQQKLQPWRYPSLYSSGTTCMHKHIWILALFFLQLAGDTENKNEELRQTEAMQKKEIERYNNILKEYSTCSFLCSLLVLSFLNVIRLSKQLCMSNQVWEKKFEILRQRYTATLIAFSTDYWVTILHWLFLS